MALALVLLLDPVPPPPVYAAEKMPSSTKYVKDGPSRPYECANGNVLQIRDFTTSPSHEGDHEMMVEVYISGERKPFVIIYSLWTGDWEESGMPTEAIVYVDLDRDGMADDKFDSIDAFINKYESACVLSLTLKK